MGEAISDRRLATSDRRLVWRSGPELRWVEAWGKNAIRVRSSCGESIRESDAALLPPGDADAEIMREYGRATGMPPLMPDCVAGFWQCKLRYKDRAPGRVAWTAELG